MFELIFRMSLREDAFDESTIKQTRQVLKWVTENLLDKTIMSLENWLEVAYHLCKQRWDDSIEWLETQPMSKINLMIQIVKQHAEDQEKAMKKAARKK